MYLFIEQNIYIDKIIVKVIMRKKIKFQLKKSQDEINVHSKLFISQILGHTRNIIKYY